MAAQGYIVAVCNNQPFVPGNAEPFDPQKDRAETYANKLRETMVQIFGDRVGALFFMPHKPNLELDPDTRFVNPHRPYVVNDIDKDSIFDSKNTTLLAYVVDTDTDNVHVLNKTTPTDMLEHIPAWLRTPDNNPYLVGAQI